MVLDTMQEATVSESTRETLVARTMRPFAHETAFRESCMLIDLIVRDCLWGYYASWKQVELELMKHQDELSREISRLPEVQSRIANIERLKMDTRRAEEMVGRHPRSKGFLRRYTYAS